ncbi:MAG: LamG-like jellyroll fold domain-containing protein [Limisphaerales bacterium]
MKTNWHECIQRYVNGLATPDDAAALQEALKEDAELRALYLDYMNLDVALGAAAEAAAMTGNLPARAQASQTAAWKSNWLRWLSWRPLTAAAAIVLAVGLLWQFTRPQVQLLRSVGAEFAAASLASGELIGRSMELKSGLIELRFCKADATAVIEAPAKFRVEDAKTLRLESGRVTAHVRDGRQGLRVLTPHTDVLDLGTRFAVDVSDGRRSEVHVFEGKVEAAVSGVARHELLTTNQALRFSTSAKPESREVRTGTFVQPEEMKSLAAGVKAGQARRALAAEAKLKQDTALIGWIGFENQPDGSHIEHGGEVRGARRVQGRFPGSHALEFVDTDDHAKLNLNATTRQLTLMTWVRLDRVPEGISSLYHTDGWDTPGQVHWSFLNNGQMRFGMHSAPAAEGNGRELWPESGDPLLGQLGRWVHLAVVYDADTQQVSFYTNGKFDSTVAMKAGLPAVLGPAQIGNWNLKNSFTTQHRRLSGRMDELVALRRMLSASEIHDYYQASNPYQ